MTRATRALLRWQNLRHNYSLAKKSAPNDAYAVIKADGYGHGLVPCAHALSGLADGFAVAFIDEAERLRSAGIEEPILVLEGAHHVEDWAYAAANAIQLVVHHPSQLDDALRADLTSEVNICLKVNTGMNRLGVMPDQVPDMLERIGQNPHLTLIRMMSHYATADEQDTAFYQEQKQRLKSIPSSVPLSISNSAGIVRGVLDEEDLIRPGIMLYGSSPIAEQSAQELGLKPVMSLQSELISEHWVKAGETVGYGQTWVADKDTRIGVVAIGYGDGYPRHAPSGTPVSVAGVRCPLVGRVSMDMITVDITQVPDATVSSPVELWGDSIDIDEIAHLAGTIGYELYCRLTSRVPRKEWS